MSQYTLVPTLIFFISLIFLVIGREITLPVWLVDVLECYAVIFFGFSPVLLIWFDLDNLT